MNGGYSKKLLGLENGLKSLPKGTDKKGKTRMRSINRIAPCYIAACCVICLFGFKANSLELKNIVTCSNPSGQSYYFEGGLIGPGQGGNQNDAIKNGNIKLYISKDGIAVSTRDAFGVDRYFDIKHMITYKEKRPDGGLNLLFTYANQEDKTVDTILIGLNANMAGTATWMFSKIHKNITKSSAFLAVCNPA